MARRRSALRTIERDAYLVSRTAGDSRALQRGGPGALLLRVLKRNTRGTVRGNAPRWMRGWL